MKTLVRKSWKDVVKNAEHHIAVGQTRVYLAEYDGYDDFPWELATEVTEGGSHRLDIATSLSVKAEHESGLWMEWTVDLEMRGSNGKGTYQIDSGNILAVLSKLPPVPARQMRSILAADAEKVRKQAEEFLSYAQRLFGDAAILAKVAL